MIIHGQCHEDAHIHTGFEAQQKTVDILDFRLIFENNFWLQYNWEVITAKVYLRSFLNVPDCMQNSNIFSL